MTCTTCQRPTWREHYGPTNPYQVICKRCHEIAWVTFNLRESEAENKRLRGALRKAMVTLTNAAHGIMWGTLRGLQEFSHPEIRLCIDDIEDVLEPPKVTVAEEAGI